MRHAPLLLALTLLPLSAYGQTPTPNCASFPAFADSEYVLAYSEPISAPDYQSWRQQAGVVAAPEGTVGTPVSDSAACTGIMQAVTQVLQTRSEWASLLQHGYSSGVLEVGQYYVVAIEEIPATGSGPLTMTSRLMVLRVSDLAYVGRLTIVG
jgi:hypothetical protein